MRYATSMRPPFVEVVRNPRGAEGVAAYRGFNAGVRSAAAHHVPDIRARHRPRSESLRLPDRGAEQRAIPIIPDTGSFDVINMATLLFAPQPLAYFYCVINNKSVV